MTTGRNRQQRGRKLHREKNKELFIKKLMLYRPWDPRRNLLFRIMLSIYKME
jgi:hypothetical protein